MSQGAIDAVLSPQEREWAFALEEALYGGDSNDEKRKQDRAFRRSSRSLRNNQNGNNNYSAWNQSANRKNQDMPSDFELASHAMIGKGNTERAIKRIRRLSAFKETYRVPCFETDINDNEDDIEAHIEAILLVIKKFLLAYPDFIKSIGLDNHGRIAIVVRLRGLRWSTPPPFNHTEAERFKALYCLMQCMQPTVEAVRRGTVWIGDLGGVTEKPASEFLVGCRMLLRDSFPMRVEDIPVVRCPPIWSGAFVGTRAYWSRKFAEKFIRVDPETLRRHFPPELLRGEERNRGAKGGVGSSGKRHARHPQRRKVKNNRSKPEAAVPNGDSYDNDWENLDDPSDEEDDDNNSVLSDWTSVGANSIAGTEDAIGKSNANDELWTKLDRLVRMRFETERTFRVA